MWGNVNFWETFQKVKFFKIFTAVQGNNVRTVNCCCVFSAYIFSLCGVCKQE